jgi:hypothetical protein
MARDLKALLGRRRLLIVAPATVVALAATACGKKEPASCTSTLGLTQDEIKTRSSLGYHDRSVDPKKHCIDCQQYVAPASVDECGGCKVLKGPVHPRGSCNVFTPKL